MTEEVELAELSRKAGEYARELRGIARALWNGSMDFDQAFSLFTSTIRLRLQSAWYEGAKACGILPAELSPEELMAMGSVIASEDSRVYQFLDWILQNNKASGGKFAPVQRRANTWALRYDDVVNRAKLQACADQKLEWVFNALGVTKSPCYTCQVKLNGKVKRASYWRRVGVQPQNPPNAMLECGGWGCLCALVITDKPLSKGPLPNLP